MAALSAAAPAPAALPRAAAAVASPYVYTRVADSTLPFPPSAGGINNRGDVAYVGATPAGDETALYLWSGGVTRELISTAGPFQVLSSPTLNDAGAVAFFGSTDAGQEGLYRLGPAGGTPARIAPNVGIGSPAPSFAFNNSGQIAYEAVRLSDGQNGVYVTDGTLVTPVLTWQGNSTTLGSLALNDAGTAAVAAPVTGAQHVYTGNGGTVTDLGEGRGPSINSDGRVAFIGPLDGHSNSIIVTTATGGLAAVASDDDPLVSFVDPSINDLGQVAFASFGLGSREGQSAIYVGDGTRLDRVVGTGDTLFGSTVTALLPSDEMLNDLGQIAFGYRLADGRVGVALASPVPEPAAAATCLVLATPLLLRRRRRPVRGAPE